MGKVFTKSVGRSAGKTFLDSRFLVQPIFWKPLWRRLPACRRGAACRARIRAGQALPLQVTELGRAIPRVPRDPTIRRQDACPTIWAMP